MFAHSFRSLELLRAREIAAFSSRVEKVGLKRRAEVCCPFGAKSHAATSKLHGQAFRVCPSFARANAHGPTARRAISKGQRSMRKAHSTSWASLITRGRLGLKARHNQSTRPGNFIMQAQNIPVSGSLLLVLKLHESTHDSVSGSPP